MTKLKETLMRLREAGEREAAAKADRVQAEVEVAAIVAEKLPPEGGTRTLEEDGVKFEVKTGFNFRADVSAIKAVAPGLVKVREEFDDRAYKALWLENADEARRVSAYVTASPSKPYVKIKEVE
jgi:hypothetical protein